MKFSWDEITAMHAYGSLFLHHLKAEGRPITTVANDPLAAALETLPPYQRATQEIDAFTVVLRDVAASLEGDHSPPFELAVVATALRHAFILGCYVTGQPNFGRSSPFRRLGHEMGLSSQLISDIEELYGFRLYQQGRAV